MNHSFIAKLFLFVFLLVGCILPSQAVFASSVCTCSTGKGDCLTVNMSAGNDSPSGCIISCNKEVPGSVSAYSLDIAGQIKGDQCISTHTNFLAVQAAVAAAASPTTSAPSTSTTPSDPIINPSLNIPIPGIGDWDSKITSSAVTTNFLATYINGVYGYLITIAITIAIVMVIIGGFQYVLASGSGHVEKGKTRIKNAIIGVILLLSSYLILKTVNPQLALLNLVEVKTVVPIQLESLVYDMGDNETSEFTGGATSTEFDAIFQKYAPCANLNWQYFRGLAAHETGLHPELLNKHCAKVNAHPVERCATGLFQALPYYCEGSLVHVGMAAKCTTPGLKDPEVNTVYGILTSKASVQHIQSLCPNADDATKAFMLYYGHGSGPGALHSALVKYKCNIADWPPDGTITKTYTNKQGKEIHEYFYNGATRAYTQDYVNKTRGFGPVIVKNGSCPFKK